ncbi:Pr6Pr family membrane protein [Spiroplasma endosymbiont of Diplazon laetatorius]|uniref:Pr6Pr family membrane protein n=1 Tax=Spiroplasma endosymbiont of Diplazon laetatorius TaxID=3066322 RepID=UPI0030D54406
MFITKQNLKDFRLWYKLVVAVLITVFLLEMLIKGMINIGVPKNNEEYSIWAIFNEKGDFIGHDYFGYVINYFSYFTIQSNILIVVWLMIGFFNHNKEGQIKPLQRALSLSVVTYITVTALIFNGLLLPQLLSSKQGRESLDALWWVEQMVLHTVGPLAAVLYFLFFMKQDLVFDFKKFIKHDFYKMAIYPVAYLAYALIRGELIYRSYGSNAPLAHHHSAYPYFFLEIHNKYALNPNMGETLINNGLFWMFMTVIIIVGIVIGLGSLYLFIGSKTSNIRNGWIKDEKKQKQAK